MRSANRSIARCRLARSLSLLLLLSLLLPFYLPNLFPSPSSLFHPQPSHTCSHPAGPSLTLHDSRFCIGACQLECFPRIRRLCFSSSQVKVCREADFGKPLERQVTSPFNRLEEYDMKQPWLPSIMRFNGEQLTLPVQYASCNGVKHWFSGLSLVADQRFLPIHRPNPHHEAEKLIPALLMIQDHGLSNTTLYWFSSRGDLSEWAKGFLEAFNLHMKVQYVDLPKKGTEMCFEDAIVFSAPTNLWYIPDQRTNTWLRERVLQHCSMSSANASQPIRSAAILDRTGGPRHLANKQQVAETVSRVLNIPVKQIVSGAGSFCNQVRAVVDDDLLIVPHGSQNVNLIFARPGTIVIEVFPYLFYTDALQNYSHAAQLHLYPNLGILPPKNILMWLFSFLGWDVCYNKVRFCKNFSRRQPIYADIMKLEEQLRKIQSSQRVTEPDDLWKQNITHITHLWSMAENGSSN